MQQCGKSVARPFQWAPSRNRSPGGDRRFAFEHCASVRFRKLTRQRFCRSGRRVPRLAVSPIGSDNGRQLSPVGSQYRDELVSARPAVHDWVINFDWIVDGNLSRAPGLARRPD